jgi:hypothetical protein
MKPFEKIESIKGQIAYYNLSEWWLSEFTLDERIYMNGKYKPFGIVETEGLLAEIDLKIKKEMDALITSLGKDLDYFGVNDPVLFLSNLSTWFDNRQDRRIAIKILNKGEELMNDRIPIKSVHFLYQQIITVHYKNRNFDTKSLEKVIKTCEQSIEIAPQVLRKFQEQKYLRFAEKRY